MKSALRSLIFTLIAINVCEAVLVGGLKFSGDAAQTRLLIIIGISTMYFLVKPVLRLLSLPSRGIGFLVVAFVLTLVLMYVMTYLIPQFYIDPGKLNELIIFGFVIPSRSLSALWTSISSAFTISLVYTFFDWLCSGHTKK